MVSSLSESHNGDDGVFIELPKDHVMEHSAPCSRPNENLHENLSTTTASTKSTTRHDHKLWKLSTSAMQRWTFRPHSIVNLLIVLSVVLFYQPGPASAGK